MRLKKPVFSHRKNYLVKLYIIIMPNRSKQMKQRKYVFRHWRRMSAIDIEPDMLKAKFIESELTKGYIPIHVKVQKTPKALLDFEIKGKELVTVSGVCAYFGKVKARKWIAKVTKTLELNSNKVCLTA